MHHFIHYYYYATYYFIIVMATLQVCPHPQNIYVIASCSLLNSTGSPSLKVLLPMAMYFNLNIGRKEVHSVRTISLQPHGIFTDLHEN